MKQSYSSSLHLCFLICKIGKPDPPPKALCRFSEVSLCLSFTCPTLGNGSRYFAEPPVHTVLVPWYSLCLCGEVSQGLLLSPLAVPFPQGEPGAVCGSIPRATTAKQLFLKRQVLCCLCPRSAGVNMSVPRKLGNF